MVRKPKPDADPDDPYGEFAAAQRDFGLTCTMRNATGKLFWGPMGKPHNRRYTLPTGSAKDTEWVQVVSWKGSIAKDQLIREKQKKHLLRRLDKPPYPPMLVYNKEGFPELTSDNYVKNHQEKQLSPRLLEMKELFFGDKQVYASPLDGRDPGSNPASQRARSQQALRDLKPSCSRDWASTQHSIHGMASGRHSSQAMGAPSQPPMHATLQHVAHAVGRTLRPKINDRQRSMWPEHSATGRSHELGLVLDRNQPRYSVSRRMALEGTNKLMRMSETHPRELWGSTQQGWGV